MVGDGAPRLGRPPPPPRLTLPTLILRGARDMSTPAIAKTLTDGIPHAREVVLPERLDTPVLEETERYLECVQAFLYAVEARARTPRASSMPLHPGDLDHLVGVDARAKASASDSSPPSSA